MRNDLTDITMVVDRSGSMASIRSDAEGGINSFVSQQQQEPGEALLTLVQFNTTYDFIHSGILIKQVPAYRLQPSGSTALLDAVGRAINETGSRLAAMEETQRPGLVVFVIVTDGQENASREFHRGQIRQMIEHQQSVYRWQFTFLAANQDAFAEGASLVSPLTASLVFPLAKFVERTMLQQRKSAESDWQPVPVRPLITSSLTKNGRRLSDRKCSFTTTQWRWIAIIS